MFLIKNKELCHAMAYKNKDKYQPKDIIETRHNPSSSAFREQVTGSLAGFDVDRQQPEY